MKKLLFTLVLFVSSYYLIGCSSKNDNNSSSSSLSTSAPTSTVASQREWINFSPYVDSQDPNLGSTVSEQQIRDRLKTIAPYVKGIRTFGSAQGLEKVAQITKQEFRLKTAIGSWLSANTVANVLCFHYKGLLDIGEVMFPRVL